MKTTAYIFIACMLCSSVYAQDDEQSLKDTYRFSVENDLLNLGTDRKKIIKGFTATGVPEDIKKSPYANTLVTKEDIMTYGATTIPEALRLVPGLLVKQTTNGNYKIYGRTTETLPIGGELYDVKASLLLVMVDGIPINDRFQGGIFWEALPISLADVERIEYVNAPVSVLHGQDGVAGVVNIITKKVEQSGLTVQGDMQGGNASTYFHNAAVSFGANEKLKVRIAGNYISTRRFQDEQFVFQEGRRVQSDSLLFFHSNANATNAQASLGRQDYGINAFLQYEINNDIEINTTISNQRSLAQSQFYDIGEFAMSQREISSTDANVGAKIYGFNLQTGYTIGEHNLAVGYQGYKFEVKKFFARVDYPIKGKNWLILPGLNYQQADYQKIDHLLSSTSQLTLTNGENSLSNYAFFLKGSYFLFNDKLRLDAGARNEIFDLNSNQVFCYQGGLTYQLISRALVRVAYSKGNRGYYMREAFENTTTILEGGATSQVVTNELPELTAGSTLEVGTRANITDKIELDLTLFKSEFDNMPFQSRTVDNSGNVTIQRENIDGQLNEVGIQAHLDTQVSGKLRLGAFATLQRSEFSGSLTTPEEEFTPAYFGGFTGSYSALLGRLNVGFSTYVYGKHYMLTRRDLVDIEGKIIPSIKISYKLWEENMVYINARNFLNMSNREYIYSDNVPALLLGGVHFNF